ncbi:hypothetical protein ACIQGO_29815 [Streptomyces shenzhenensis]|uniref:hypothetical protein n=1 Tax=Streptomyces shenzhenensis TaxID=943815 RepID=UPI0037F292A1
MSNYFSESEFKKGKRTFRERLETYRGLGKSNKSLHKAVDAYFAQLEAEGNLIEQGVLPREIQTNPAVVEKLLTEFDKARALEIQAVWWLKNQDRDRHSSKEDWGAAKERAAERHVAHTGAWSKTTGYPAEKRALANNGRTLELAPAFAAHDGLNMGAKDWSRALPSVVEFWDRGSARFMDKSEGVVHADVFEAVDPKSVLAKVEIPALDKLMESGQVDAVTIHVRRRDSSSRILKEIATIDVHSRGSFEQLEKVKRTDSQKLRQEQEYRTQQVGRSIMRNRLGLQGSLKAFSRFIKNDPDTVMFITPQGQQLPRMSVTDESWRALQTLQSSSTDNLYKGLQEAAEQRNQYASVSSSSSGSYQPTTADTSAYAATDQSGSVPYPSQGYGSQGYGSQGYGTQGYGSQSSNFVPQPLVPVNTLDYAANPDLYMSSTHGGGYLPTQGQMVRNYGSDGMGSGSDQAADSWDGTANASDFQSGVDFHNPWNTGDLSRAMTGLSMADVSPNTSRLNSYAQGSYYAGGGSPAGSVGSQRYSPPAASGNPAGDFANVGFEGSNYRQSSESPPPPSTGSVSSKSSKGKKPGPAR